jgi:DNA mismatch endonuclease (patch repair protein)
VEADFQFITTPERSALMKKIRSNNTGPELVIRKLLWENGYRYRLNAKKLPGKPDIVLNKYKTIIFVDGEFWHGFNWEQKRNKIKANREYWIPKIENNIKRDIHKNKLLKEMGFKVLRFWEQDILKDLDSVFEKIIDTIHLD